MEIRWNHNDIFKSNLIILIYLQDIMHFIIFNNSCTPFSPVIHLLPILMNHPKQSFLQCSIWLFISNLQSTEDVTSHLIGNRTDTHFIRECPLLRFVWHHCDLPFPSCPCNGFVEIVHCVTSSYLLPGLSCNCVFESLSKVPHFPQQERSFSLILVVLDWLLLFKHLRLLSPHGLFQVGKKKSMLKSLS